MKRTLRLRSISGPTKGQVWESDGLLRVGRLASLELVLDDSSVSRHHAEVRVGAGGQWHVRDFDSTNGTYVNGARTAGEERPIKARDVVQFGKVAVLVELVEATRDGPPSDQLVVTASTRSNGFDSVESRVLGGSSNSRTDNLLHALFEANKHLVHLDKEEELLDSILNECVQRLDAQRGAIALADGEGSGAEPKLRSRAIAVGGGDAEGRFHYSRRLVLRCYTKEESVLLRNVQDEKELMNASISDGAMSSVLCIFLRTPRKKLGVLYLDRGCLQAPFNKEDLYFADALACHVSSSIECAQLLKQQRESYQRTLTMLAAAVELRDEYTAGHTQRVTRYATLLAERLGVSEGEMVLVKIGTPLHDFGKLGIGDAILNSPRRLTPDEFATMQKHTILGAEYLSKTPDLHEIIPIVRSHHERWDGTGYPDRLRGEETPLLARIVAVADAFDAMTSYRPYHDPRHDRAPPAAFAEIARQSGRQFDPRCAQAFLDIREQVVAAFNEMADRVPNSGTYAAAATRVGMVAPVAAAELSSR